jgi:hypothetical protein
MDIKPGDLFVGVADFFAVLLPGAILCFLVADEAREFAPNLLEAGRADDKVVRWVMFVACAYIVGHFIHAVGSLLDDTLYKNGLRPVIARVKGEDAFEHVRAMQQSAMGAERRAAMNPFKWARAHVELWHSEAAAQVRRLEADSKFFRSFIVLLVVLAVASLWRRQWAEASTCGVMLLLSCWRYADQRWKYTQLAYQYLLVLGNSSERHKPGSGDRDA